MSLHYHVKRADYDSRTAKDFEPIEIGVADTYPEARELAREDEKQFRLPNADRFVFHSWACPSCNLVHA